MLDDLAPLRQLSAEVAGASVHLFASAPAWRLDGARVEEDAGRGDNPPPGAVVDFVLVDPEVGTEVSLAFLDAEGELLRELRGTYDGEEGEEGEDEGAGSAEGEAADEGEETTSEEEEAEEDDDAGKLELRAGHNRVAWDLRLAEAEDFEGMILWGGGTEGPRVPPGSYQARLTVGDTVLTEPFEVRADPASASDVADLDEQFRFLCEVRDKLTEVHTQIRRIRAVRGQLVELKKRLGTEAEEIREAADALDEAITAVEEALYQTKNQSPQDPLNFPIRLNDKLAAVAGVAAIGDHAPTAQAWEVKRELEAKIDAELATLAGIWDDRLPALNAMVQGAAVPALTVEEE
jgi:hypothetical protein